MRGTRDPPPGPGSTGFAYPPIIGRNVRRARHDRCTSIASGAATLRVVACSMVVRTVDGRAEDKARQARKGKKKPASSTSATSRLRRIPSEDEDEDDEDEDDGRGWRRRSRSIAAAAAIDVGERPTTRPTSLEAPSRRSRDGGSLARRDPMAAYMREVRRYPLLTPEEENALAVRLVEHGDTARGAQADRGQPAARREDRLRVPPRAQEPARPGAGGQHRPHPGGRRSSTRTAASSCRATRRAGSARTSSSSSSTTGGW